MQKILVFLDQMIVLMVLGILAMVPMTLFFSPPAFGYSVESQNALISWCISKGKYAEELFETRGDEYDSQKEKDALVEIENWSKRDKSTPNYVLVDVQRMIRDIHRSHKDKYNTSIADSRELVDREVKDCIHYWF